MDVVLDDPGLQLLQDLWNQQDNEEDLIFKTHYQLATQCGRTAEEWKAFLRHPRVVTWINEELEMYTQNQLRTLIQAATDNDRSVGAAQMINALHRTIMETESTEKTGPIIIYTYVPLSAQQIRGADVEYRQADRDLFELGADMYGTT